MAAKPHIVSDNEIALFNAKRENLKGKELNRTDLLKELKKINLTDTRVIAQLMQGENPPIVHVTRGVYRLAKDPVYKGRLQTAYDSVREVRRVNRIDMSHPTELAIKEAITLLKNAGYKILKPVTEYEEV